jgi:DNA-binding CsgD family transcriptional regulator
MNTDTASAPDRERIEQELMGELRAAERAYQDAVRYSKTLVEQHEDLPLGHPDGNYVRRQAAAYEAHALKTYTKALQAFADMVMFDRRPASPSLSQAPACLTPRETEVLVLIAQGLSSKQIATRLGITFKTAICPRSWLMDKLDIHNVADLVRYTIAHKLIEP